MMWVFFTACVALGAPTLVLAALLLRHWWRARRQSGRGKANSAE
jgi:hypothetical protein